ncbi:Tail fiber protein [Pleurotus pulmonarius]
MSDTEIIDAARRLKELQAGDSTDNSETAREYINQLTPPIGTSFFKRQTVTLFDNVKFYSKSISLPEGDAQVLVQTLTWKVDVYTYVTGARPDQEQFEANGGSVMVVVVHSGHLSFDSRKGRSIYRVTAPTSVASQKQLPPTGSGIKNEDYWNYSISYQEIMNMFNNGGNGTLNFDAKYKEDFSRKDPLTGITLSNGVEFGTEFESNNTDLPAFNLAGVSIFRSNTPDAFPAKFSFEANSAWILIDNLGFASNKKVEVEVDINRGI